MANIATTSDERLLELFRRQGPLGIGELVEATQVTATAVRQRLSRLINRGLVDRVTHHSRRGRPSHRYQLSVKGQRSAGTNFADLASILWRELRNVGDENLRQELVGRVAKALASLIDQPPQENISLAKRAIADQPNGAGADRPLSGSGASAAALDERMRTVAAAFAERNVPFVVEASSKPEEHGLPVLTALACPFPGLAEEDRAICDVERMMFEELIGAEVRLAECRLDGARCCKFAMN